MQALKRYCLNPTVASRVLILLGIIYFIWIFTLLFSSASTSQDDPNSSSASRRKGASLFSNTQQQRHSSIENSVRQHTENTNSNDQQPSTSTSNTKLNTNNAANNNNNDDSSSTLSTSSSSASTTTTDGDEQCFTTRHVYLVIPVSTKSDIDDLCDFGTTILQDAGLRKTTHSGSAHATGSSGGGNRQQDKLEQQVIANPKEEFVAVVDPVKCSELDDPLKCGWIHKRSKDFSSSTASADSIRGLLPEIKVDLFIAAANDELFTFALSKVSGPQACESFKNVVLRKQQQQGNGKSNNKKTTASSSASPRSSTSVTLDSVKVVHSGVKQTIDGGLASGLHHALMAARKKDFVSSSNEIPTNNDESDNNNKKPHPLSGGNNEQNQQEPKIPPLAIRAHTHFIASVRPHLIPTSPGLLRILLDSIIRSGEISPSRPSALNNVPIGMSSRYPCTNHPYHHYSAATSPDQLTIRRQAADRFTNRVVGLNCLGLVSDENLNNNKGKASSTSSTGKSSVLNSNGNNINDIIKGASTNKDNNNNNNEESGSNNNNNIDHNDEDFTDGDEEDERFGVASSMGSDFSVVPSRFESSNGPSRVLTVQLTRSLAKRRFKLIHKSRRSPLQVDDDGIRMSRDHILQSNDVLSGSCFMIDAAAMETALSGESLQQESFFTNTAWQERMNQVLLPPANSPIHVRETESKMQALVNAERRLLFVYSMAKRFNETFFNLNEYRKVLTDQERQRELEKINSQQQNMKNGFDGEDPLAQQQQQQRHSNNNKRNTNNINNNFLAAIDDKNKDGSSASAASSSDANNNNPQRNNNNKPVVEEYHEDPDLQHRKWVFDEFKNTNRIDSLILDTKAMIDEIGFSRHVSYLEDSGWWLSIPTSNVTTNFKTGAYYRCRIGDSTFYSLVHCWSTILGVRLADPDFIASSSFQQQQQQQQSDGTSSPSSSSTSTSKRDRRRIARAVDFLETIFSKEMDPHALFMSLDLDSLSPSFELVRHAFLESAARYRHLTEKFQHAVHLSGVSESRVDLSAAGLSLSMREQLKCNFGTSLIARVEDISLFRNSNNNNNKNQQHGGTNNVPRQSSSSFLDILRLRGSISVTPFSVILPPNHPLRAYLLTVDSIKSRIIEKKNCIMIPFWIDIGGSTLCESQRHVDGIFGALPGTTPWSVSPLAEASHDSEFTFVGSRQGCSSNRRETHRNSVFDEHHQKLLLAQQQQQQKQDGTTGGGVGVVNGVASPTDDDDDDDDQENNRQQQAQDEDAGMTDPITGKAIHNKNSRLHKLDGKRKKNTPRRRNNNNNKNKKEGLLAADELTLPKKTKRIDPSATWCSSSCSHPHNNPYYEANSVAAHIYPFTSSHSHAVTFLTGHADVLATQLSVHASLLQAFVPFSLSWILGRAANSAVLLSGMEQFRLSHGTIRFALCFTYWCSEMMQRYADDTVAIFRVAFPYVPASLFNPLETKQLFKIYVAPPTAANNKNNNKNKQDDENDIVILPGGISLTKGSKMNDMSSLCSLPASSSLDDETSTGAKTNKNTNNNNNKNCISSEPFIIGAPIPWEKGNATRALESIDRLVTAVQNVKVVTHCHIQVVVLLLHAPAMIKIESVIRPFMDRLSPSSSNSDDENNNNNNAEKTPNKISMCIFSTEGVKWNDHDTADFLSSSTIIIHPLNPTGWPHLAIQTLLMSKPLILPHCCGLAEIAKPNEAFFAELVGADIEHRRLVNSVGEDIIVRHWNYHVNLTQVTNYIELLQKNHFLGWVVARRGHVQATRKAAGVDPHTIYRTMRFVAGQMQSVVIDAVKAAAGKTKVEVSENTIRRILGMQDDRFQLS